MSTPLIIPTVATGRLNAANRNSIWDGSTCQWFGHKLDVDVALTEAENFYRAIKNIGGMASHGDSRAAA